jgi:hypothetical protein
VSAGVEFLELQAVCSVGRTIPRWPTAEESYEHEYLNLKTLGGSDAIPLQTRALVPPGVPHARAVSAMAKISSSGADAAPLAPPQPEPPAAEGHGGGAAADDDDDDDDNNSLIFPLVDLLERFPDLFAQKVLMHLDPIDRTFLAQAGSACRAAVAASDMPRAGTRAEELRGSVWVVTHKISEFCTSVERLAWAKASGCPWVARTCALAARDGQLEVLRFARAHNCPWNEDTCAWAAQGGHLEVLKWAWEHNCPLSEGTCWCAAWHGHLEVLKWAREHHCPWDEDTCLWAAHNGHLELLRWARAHGCPWIKRQCELGLPEPEPPADAGMGAGATIGRIR